MQFPHRMTRKQIFGESILHAFAKDLLSRHPVGKQVPIPNINVGTGRLDSSDRQICLCRYICYNFVYLCLQQIMLAFLHRILDWFKNVFWKEEMELALVGLQNSGKTTFVNVISV